MDFLKPWGGSNCKLNVEGKIFYVHKITLSLNSLVFDEMFDSQSENVIMYRIELPDGKFKESKEMLGIIYDRSKVITGMIYFLKLTLICNWIFLIYN